MKTASACVLIAAVLTAGCTKEPETLEELKKAGRRAFVSEEYAKARNYLGRAVAQAPSDKQILYFMGLSYSRDMMYDSALHYLGRADVLHPDDREINLEIYRIAREIGEPQVAKDAISVLMKTGDPPEKYYREMGELSVQQGMFFLANSYFRLLLKSEPDNPQNYLDAANVAAEIDSLKVSVSIMDSAITRFGERMELLQNKAIYLIAQDKFADAERILRDLLEQEPQAVEVRLNLAHTLAEQEDKDKKREAYDLYSSLRDTMPAGFAIDSLMQELEKQL